jgi:hypothetical protein
MQMEACKGKQADTVLSKIFLFILHKILILLVPKPSEWKKKVPFDGNLLSVTEAMWKFDFPYLPKM